MRKGGERLQIVGKTTSPDCEGTHIGAERIREKKRGRTTGSRKKRKIALESKFFLFRKKGEKQFWEKTPLGGRKNHFLQQSPREEKNHSWNKKGGAMRRGEKGEPRDGDLKRRETFFWKKIYITCSERRERKCVHYEGEGRKGMNPNGRELA